MDSWIKLYRKSMESEIWLTKPSTWYKVWQYILLKVSHKETKLLKAGQGFFNFRNATIHIGSDVTYHTVDNCMRFLKRAKQITTQKTRRGVVVTVLNYKLYQSSENVNNDTENGTRYESYTKQERNINEMIYNKNKRIKELKNTNKLVQKDSESFALQAKEILNTPEDRLVLEKEKELEGGLRQYGNPDINFLISYMKEKLGLPILDDSEKENRRFCHLTMKKFGNVEKIKTLIDSASVHDFWATRITSFRSLYKHGVNIISSARDLKHTVVKI